MALGSTRARPDRHRDTAQRRSFGVRARRGSPGPLQDPLFDLAPRPERRYYRQMLEMLTASGFGSSPLEAEMAVSKILGVVWASDAHGGAEEAFGLGLVDYARSVPTPTAVALLRTLEVVATSRAVRAAAAAGVAALVDVGLPSPDHIGAVSPGKCWAHEDAFGDVSTLICSFAYGSAVHAISVRVDHAVFGAATACSLITGDLDAQLESLRRPLWTLRRVEPGYAGALLDRAFGRTDLIPNIGVAAGFASLRAFVLSRVDTLPFAPQLLPLPAPLGPAEVAAVAASFLRSPEGIGVPPALASLLASFSAERDPGNPLRVGPLKWEAFLFDYLPAGPLDPGVPDAVRAWSTWAARRAGLSDDAVAHLRASVEELLTIRS